MGLLRTTCDRCGTTLWRWSDHRFRKCRKIQDKKKVEEQDLTPIPNPPHNIERYEQERWLKNHGFPVENLFRHPYSDRFTSQEGREALSNVEFADRRKTSRGVGLSIKESTERGEDTYIECWDDDFIIEIDSEYSSEALDKYDRHLVTDGDPVEDDEPPTVYTASYAKLGTVHVKEQMIASKI